MNFNQNMPRYRIIQRASTLWTSFRGGILGCQKGVAFHAPPLQHGSRRRFQFEIPLKTYQDCLCYARDRRQISITPRRLYVIILRTFVIPSSTPFNLNDVESGSRRSAFRSQHEGYYKLPPLYCLVHSHCHKWRWPKMSAVRRSVLWPGVHKSTTLWF